MAKLTELLCNNIINIQETVEIKNVSEIFINDDVFFTTIRDCIKSEKETSYKINILKNIAWIIFSQAQSISFGHKYIFKPSDGQEFFQEFIYKWDRLTLKRIPFNEWSDIAQEGIDLLKILIEENKLEQFENDSRYKDFMKKFGKRHEDLRLSGKYPDLNELMDD